MMPEEFRSSSHFVQQIERMDVHLDEAGRTVLVCIGDARSGTDRIVYALSPPAAKQLAKLLRGAVKDHLNYKPPTPSSPNS